ncbi:hypothetical protein BU17DRAFT_80192 [Hysterangium stoloniferum]|nr:hypothetical protein BU17DRAFT_80192 [Hysterangium stoloniferum]
MDAASTNQTPTEVESIDRPRLPSPAPQLASLQPLAPLEYLQNQRRGSITDPSLHASPPDPTQNHHYHHHHQQLPLNHSTEQRVKRSPRTIRPTSPFVFGDASVHPPDLSSPHIRRLLRSPSNEALDSSHSPDRSDDSSRTRDLRASSLTPDRRTAQDESRSWASSDSQRDKRSDQPATMDIDNHTPDDDADFKARQGIPHIIAGPASGTSQGAFDFNMRRHSIADHPVPHRGMPHPPNMPHPPSRSPGMPSLPQGLKRKMSPDRSTLYPMGEEDASHHQTALPDIQGPAPKRRSSAFDTHRIAQLSLYDRREPIDSRTPPIQGSQGVQGVQWWLQDRRDSTSSMFSNASLGSVGGYSSSGFSGESAFPAPRQGLANMAWPPAHLSAGSNHEADTPIHGLPRHFPPRVTGPGDDALTPFPPIPPTTMPPDRRMSVPDISSTGQPQRNLRSKSRPPSSSVASRAVERQPSTNPSEGDGMAEDSEASPTQQHMLHPSSSLKDGASPYSRSPELRVSHKLAERKRRKEMKDLFDELREQLPADRGMKASKWEILTKAVDFIQTLKTSQQELTREVEMLRRELDTRSNSQFQQNATSNHSTGYNAGFMPPGLSQSQHAPADSAAT